MKQVYSTLFFLLLLTGLKAQELYFPFASRPVRDSVARSLRQQIQQTLQLPLQEATVPQWLGACWAMELQLYRPAGFDTLISRHLQQLPQLSVGMQRAYLQMLYTLYPQKYAQSVAALLPRLQGHKNKAMALEYLRQAGYTAPLQLDSAFLQSDFYRLHKQYHSRAAQPKLRKEDVLHADFLPGEDLLVSFQHRNRNRPGYLQIRLGTGSWLHDTNGVVLQYPQLARSITHLPYYLTNGNTPQGLYRITGLDTSANLWIGPTTNLQLVLPFEQAHLPFFDTGVDVSTVYRKMLGPFAAVTDLWESFEAGRVGRTEIIAHGTTIDPSFYAGQPYWPHTPSLGCLCSPEWWNEQGMRERSTQEDWIRWVRDRLVQARWLLVVEVNDL